MANAFNLRTSKIMSHFQTLDDLSLRGRIVLLRSDLNVPMHNGRVTDRERLERLLLTLKDLSTAGAKIVILSHFGRPKGSKPDPELSLRPAAAELQELWGQPIAFAEDCIGPIAEQAIKSLAVGQILVLENTRFHTGEEANDPAFVDALASLGEIFVNDAFSCAHRAHASTEGLAHKLPAAAGRLMQAELKALEQALGKPERPVVAVVGGSKISTKLDLLNNLMTKVDALVLGGGMANTFLAAQNIPVGKSLIEADMVDIAFDIMSKAQANNCHIVLPKDVVVAAALQEGVAVQTVSVKAIPQDLMILDLGPQSIAEIKETIAACRTVVWNGPLGAFEIEPFDRATNQVAIDVSEMTKRGRIISVAGGGDTVSALSHAGVAHGFSYLSTAGGAFLEWLEGKTLPGVAALAQAQAKRKIGKVIM
jgi:phosphoglycerate kinase